MRREAACPGKGQDSNTTDMNKSVLRGNKTVILTRLLKFGHQPIKLPILFHELSAFRISKTEAWKLIFELRDAGYIEYHPFHSIQVLRGRL